MLLDTEIDDGTGLGPAIVWARAQRRHGDRPARRRPAHRRRSPRRRVLAADPRVDAGRSSAATRCRPPRSVRRRRRRPHTSPSSRHRSRRSCPSSSSTAWSPARSAVSRSAGSSTSTAAAMTVAPERPARGRRRGPRPRRLRHHPRRRAHPHSARRRRGSGGDSTSRGGARTSVESLGTGAAAALATPTGAVARRAWSQFATAEPPVPRRGLKHRSPCTAIGRRARRHAGRDRLQRRCRSRRHPLRGRRPPGGGRRDGGREFTGGDLVVLPERDLLPVTTELAGQLRHSVSLVALSAG